MRIQILTLGGSMRLKFTAFQPTKDGLPGHLLPACSTTMEEFMFDAHFEGELLKNN